MTKRFFNLAIATALINGCSSTNSHDSETAEPGATYSNSSVRGAAKPDQPAVKEEPVKREAPANSGNVTEDQYDHLYRAVKTQNDDDIARAASRILLQNPKDVRGLNTLALVNYKKGRFETALYLLNKAAAQNTNSSEVHSNLGLVYMAIQEKREAIRAFKKALEINSQDGVAAANLGGIFAQEKDFNKAVIALEIAYKRGFRDAKVSNNYAISLVATGKNAEADSIYKNLIKENSSNKEVLFNYIVFLVDHEQRYKEAIEYINRLKFVGVPSESRNRIIALENKAKAGLK